MEMKLKQLKKQMKRDFDTQSEIYVNYRLHTLLDLLINKIYKF
jgi:hypothetical protein